MAAGSSFCPGCGVKVGAPVSSPAPLAPDRFAVRRRRAAWVGGGIVAAIAALVIYGRSGSDSVKSWCRANVHVGTYLTALKMPGAPHLVSVNNGVWTYDDGVKVTFLDDQVYEADCG